MSFEHVCLGKGISGCCAITASTGDDIVHEWHQEDAYGVVINEGILGKQVDWQASTILRYAPIWHTRHSPIAHLVIVHGTCKDTGIWSQTVSAIGSNAQVMYFRHLLLHPSDTTHHSSRTWLLEARLHVLRRKSGLSRCSTGWEGRTKVADDVDDAKDEAALGQHG